MKFLPLLLLLVSQWALAQSYSDHAKLSQRLKSLETSNPQSTKLTSIAKTAGGKDIWLLEIGSGDRTTHPAIAVIGGVEGSHLLGTELAIGFAEKLLASANTDSVKALLAGTTFYVFPNVSPDASEQYFAKVKYERNVNATATDDDRDGKVNEDPFEDLNNDGQITWIRIEDPTGKWKVHPADPRVMVMANSEKGEKGTHNVIPEGTDNDKDGKFNEDGEGGVAFNKSLTFDPPYFTPGAGEHPVSEIENRAVLDYLYERFNVYAVVTFGPTNNLSEPWKFDKAKNAGRIPGGIMENDAKQNKLAGDLYKKSVTLKDAPAAGPQKGDVSQWAYFHYGRQSFSTPGWWAPKFEIPKDTAAAKKFKANDDKNTDVDFIRWADKEKLDVFLNWTKISHADYPNMNTEIGGFKPFVKANPPFSYVDKLANEHMKFVYSIAARKPQVELLNLKVEALDGGVSRITVTIQNSGLFPAITDIGKNNNWIKLVKLALVTSGDQTIVGGKKVTLFPNLEAGESKTISWLVKGKGKVTIEAGAPQTGFKTLNASL
ncbi:MAG TPA: M14 family metallopeptidase [Cyclobacteriaceae bacterium]|nr:M14 family metallopeptidase [Cyclobacteriaceae bacterium]